MRFVKKTGKMLRPLRRLLFRASPRQNTPWPLAVRSVGHYRLPKGWCEESSPKWFCQLFWILRGSGFFEFEGGRVEAGPDSIFHYLPGESHRIICPQGSWEYRWVTFDGPDAVRWLQSFGLQARGTSPGVCPEYLFRKIETGISEGTPTGERRASLAAYELLGAIMDGITSPPASHALAARKLLDLGVSDMEVSVETVAAQLGIHRSSLYRLFMREFGIGPLRYLRNLRVQRALSLLRETSLPLTEITGQCGFADVDYLSRVVRNATGQSPRKFRNE